MKSVYRVYFLWKVSTENITLDTFGVFGLTVVLWNSQGIRHETLFDKSVYIRVDTFYKVETRNKHSEIRIKFHKLNVMYTKQSIGLRFSKS